eukprot:scaffold84885_cov30-Tisochrysis_lutea.AAC.5
MSIDEPHAARLGIGMLAQPLDVCTELKHGLAVHTSRVRFKTDVPSATTAREGGSTIMPYRLTPSASQRTSCSSVSDIVAVWSECTVHDRCSTHSPSSWKTQKESFIAFVLLGSIGVSVYGARCRLW